MPSKITALASSVFEQEFNISGVEIQWSQPQDLSHGDLTTSIALAKAKECGVAPREIAKKIVDAIKEEAEVEKAEVAGAGYVNVTLTPEALLERLSSTREACTAKVQDPAKTVVMDYSHPNVAKPLGIHHILSTVIGQSLMNLHKHLGYQSIGINHLGDWGTQFGKVAVALEKWGEKPLSECKLDDLLKLYVRFHEEAEKDEALEDEAREAFKKIEQGDEKLRAFWEEVVSITVGEMEELYKRLHVSFDHIHGESFYEDKMQPIVEEGKEKDVFVEGKEGALIVEFDESTNLSPAIVMKGDDASIYFTRDLATARYRIDTFKPIEMLYIVDVAQEYYFKQLFEALKLLDWELPSMEHIAFGRMSFKDKNMSTRKGNILKLQEVFDESFDRAKEAIKEHGDKIQADNIDQLAEMMGIGSVVYGVLNQSRKQNMIFDWDKMLSFDGNSAPYVQYTHARARSVLRKGEYEGGDAFAAGDLGSKERVLVNTLLKFADVLEEARKARMPHMLANFIFDLCQAFNAFYNDDPILKAEGEMKDRRLALTKLTADVIKVSAEILTIRVPDRM